MKGKFEENKNTRPVLDRLGKDYAKQLDGNLIETLSKLHVNMFQASEVEYVFQLIEAELRATDAIQIKTLLETLREAHQDRWMLIQRYAEDIEENKVTSASSHQLIALIQLAEES